MKIDAAPKAISMMPAQKSLLLRNAVFIRKAKSEIRISKSETNRGQNKSQTRKTQNLESDSASFAFCSVWIIWICFEFRISSFEFVLFYVLLSLRLCRSRLLCFDVGFLDDLPP